MSCYSRRVLTLPPPSSTPPLAILRTGCRVGEEAEPGSLGKLRFYSVLWKAGGGGVSLGQIESLGLPSLPLVFSSLPSLLLLGCVGERGWRPERGIGLSQPSGDGRESLVVHTHHGRREEEMEEQTRDLL